MWRLKPGSHTPAITQEKAKKIPYEKRIGY